MERINTLVDQYDFLKNEAKIKEILDAYANNDNVIAAKQEEIAAKQKEIAAKQEEITNKQEEIEKKKKEITNKQEEITNQKKNIDKANEELQYKDEQIKKDCEKHKQNAKNNNITGVNDFTVPCNVDNAILRDRWNRDRNGTITKAKEIIKKNTEEIEKNTKEIETNQSELAELNKQKVELNTKISELNNELNNELSKNQNSINTEEILNTYDKAIKYINLLAYTFNIPTEVFNRTSFTKTKKIKHIHVNSIKNNRIKSIIEALKKITNAYHDITIGELIDLNKDTIVKTIQKQKTSFYDFFYDLFMQHDVNVKELKHGNEDNLKNLKFFFEKITIKLQNSKTRYSRSSYANYAMYTQYTF